MVTAIETKQDLKVEILRHLRKGEANAIKKVALARLCGSNERQVRQALRELTVNGIPVCGSPHPPYGYYIAETTEEIRQEMHLIRNSYGMELLRRYQALKRCLRKMEVPLHIMDDWQIRLL